MHRIVSRLIATILIVGTGTSASLSQTTPPNVRLNTDASPFLQNEEQVWINLTDSLNVIANWRDWRLGYRRVGVGRSTDGGATWTDQLVNPLIFERQSDPILVGDNSGRFFMNMLDYDPSAALSSHIVVYTSTNGGLFWNGPVPIQPLGPYFEDKQFSAVDRTGGPFDGYYYCSWTRFPDAGRNTMILVRSTDGGATFDDTVAVGPRIFNTACGTFDQGQFSIPIINTDGSVHVFWQGLHVDSVGGCGVYRAIRRNTSFDGGASFAGDTVAFFPNLDYDFVDGGINVYGMPNGDADISGGPYDGTIYITQTQYADGLGGETDIWVKESTDNGITWSPPVVVNDDLPGQNIDQFHPWLIVNEDGVVVMIFYDQRQDPVGHFLFDCYFAASFDGAETFTTNYRLSSVSSSPINLATTPARITGPRMDPYTGLVDPSVAVSPAAGLIAEYIGVHAKHDYNVAVWTDTRDLTQDVYSARFETPFLKPRLYEPADQLVIPDSVVAFLWSTSWHESQDSYRLEVSTDPTFTTVDATYSGLTENNFTPAVPLSPNTYHWRVKAFRTAGDSSDYSDTWTYTTGCDAGAAPTPLIPAEGDTLDDSTVTFIWSAVGDAIDYQMQLSTDSNFTTLHTDTTLSLEGVSLSGLTSDSTMYYWRIRSTNTCGTGDWALSNFLIDFCPVLQTGDVNVDGILTSADIINMVNFAFKSGPPPLPIEAAGDTNCSGSVGSADIIIMVNHVFKSAAPPCDVCSIL
jgi:hypothetical protein